MERKFLHEHHNRQEKAFKPDYLEEMRHPDHPSILRAKQPKHPTGPKPQEIMYTWVISRKRQFDHIEPAVASKLHKLFPTINLTPRVDAIRSYLRDKHQIEFTTRRATELQSAYDAVNRVIKLRHENIAGSFLKWHDQTARKIYRNPQEPFEIPQEFCKWLSKPGFQTVRPAPHTETPQPQPTSATAQQPSQQHTDS